MLPGPSQPQGRAVPVLVVHLQVATVAQETPQLGWPEQGGATGETTLQSS
jgi:hypothetical protein